MLHRAIDHENHREAAPPKSLGQFETTYLVAKIYERMEVISSRAGRLCLHLGAVRCFGCFCASSFHWGQGGVSVFVAQQNGSIGCDNGIDIPLVVHLSTPT